MKKNVKSVPEIRFPGFTDLWELRKVGEFAVESCEKGHNGQEALKLTVKLHTKGVCKMEEKGQGSDNTQYYVRHAGQLIYGKQNFFNGAIGIVPQSLDGYESTKDVPSFDIDDNVCVEWFYQYIARPEIYKSQEVNCTGTGSKRFHVNAFFDMNIPIPLIEEQKKISDYFKAIDNLITLQEQRCQVLKRLKQCMLQKMFPKDGSDTPEIRFPGFTDSWEQRKVSEITKFHKQGFYTTEEYDNSKKYYLLRGTDLTENKLVLKDTPKIDATEKDYDAFKTEIGDFLIVRSGIVGTYGIVDVDIPAIFGSYLIDFRFDMEQVTNEFFGYFYQSSLFKLQLNKIIQASANTNINAENIKSTVISLPSLNEQRRISEYLGNLDHLITFSEKKCKVLKKLKKCMLQKMFV